MGKGYRFWDSPFPLSEVERFNRVLKEKGVEAALEVVSRPQWVVRSALDISRGMWLHFFRRYLGRRCVDLGCGFGVLTRYLADMVDEVYGVDVTPQRVETLRILEPRVRAIVGGIMEADLPENYFDSALLIGVLEWVGDSYRDGSVEKVQIRVLRRIRSLLRSGGVLIIGIENRFGSHYIKGRKDHTRTRYTSLMPRMLADMFCRVKKKRPYRTYTYTRRGYVRLLRAAGFNHFRFYATIPDYRYPRRIFSYDKDPTNLLRFFVPAFFIIASPQPLPPPAFSSFLRTKTHALLFSNSHVLKIGGDTTRAYENQKRWLAVNTPSHLRTPKTELTRDGLLQTRIYGKRWQNHPRLARRCLQQIVEDVLNYRIVGERTSTNRLRLTKPIPFAFCHNDMKPKNILSASDGIYLFDFDLAGEGPITRDAFYLVIRLEAPRYDRIGEAISALHSRKAATSWVVDIFCKKFGFDRRVELQLLVDAALAGCSPHDIPRLVAVLKSHIDLSGLSLAIEEG